MRKEAFTLIELIFVIVIIGILSTAALNSFKPHYLSNDMNFVLIKLEEIRYKAMGYNKALPTLSSDINYSIGCIDIDDINKTDNPAYKFHAIVQNRPFEVLCFDTLGREHNGTQDNNQTTLDSLMAHDINLTYKYNNNKKKSIIIDYLTGAIRIK